MFTRPMCVTYLSCAFFFNDPATTEIYTYLHTLSLHDALPILLRETRPQRIIHLAGARQTHDPRSLLDDNVLATVRLVAAACDLDVPDRKSTRLNSSH